LGAKLAFFSDFCNTFATILFFCSMLFNSLSFVIFYPLVTLLYFLLPHRYRWQWLLLMSSVFYMAFVPLYILILLFTIGIDYIAGILIESAQGRQRKWYLGASLVANIGILAFFKYYNFGISNLNWVLQYLNFDPLPLLHIVLPIGLSFHTFQAMSYTIEVYRGHQKAERHLGIYALYVLFYPQLVAGPIERPQNLLPQFRAVHRYNNARLYEGLSQMLWGFFKKMVIADRLAVYVSYIFDSPFHYHPINIIIASFFFTIQIYCDFSGYSDIAIGAARTMGFDLMQNFKQPYFSTNIQTFWQRWHISLSTWFRDYLYISLGGNRVRRWKIYRNVAIVFLVSGLWHGANWNYIVWGMLQGFWIILYMLYNDFCPYSLPDGRWWRGLYICCTFIGIVFSWIFFRANSLDDAWQIFHNLLTWQTDGYALLLAIKDARQIEFGTLSYLIAGFSIAILLAVDYFQPSHSVLLFPQKPLLQLLWNIILLVLIFTLGVFYQQSFIYFQF
jgi:D-alanyl-lipoteichoic acid acyltransferase DltB (MBOAT superfamily)